MAARSRKSSAGARRAASAKTSKTRGGPKRARAQKGKASSKSSRTEKQSSQGAADALVGLLESPLVADVLAAGAAAALATFTHHSLTRKSEGGSKQALKDAAKAAASAMGARLSTELDEIMKAAEQSRREES